MGYRKKKKENIACKKEEQSSFMYSRPPTCLGKKAINMGCETFREGTQKGGIH